MGQTLERQPCNNCNSTDNVVIWEYQGKRFQKCQTPGCSPKAFCIDNSIVQQTIVNDERPNIEKFLKKDTSWVSDLVPSSEEWITGEYRATRGLTEETCRKCGILVQGNQHIFKYKDAQKVRFPTTDGEKGMYWQGYSQNAGLFLEELFDGYNTETPIIITEGEFDAATLIQLGYQSASISTGSGGADKEIKERLEKLEKFSEIVLWFDGDEAGQKAIKKVLAIPELPIWKVRIVNHLEEYGVKDVNELLELQGEDTKITVNFLIDQADYVPVEGVLLGKNLDKTTLLTKIKKGMNLGIEPLNTMVNGLKWGKLILVAGGSNIGKTPVMRHLAFELFNKYDDIKLAHIFLEESLKETEMSFIAMENNIPMEYFEEDPLKYITKEKFDQDYEKYINTDRIAFTDEQYTLDSQKLIKNLYYMNKKGINLFILDHIQIVIDASPGKEGERKDIDRLSRELAGFVKKTGSIVIAACHLSQPSDGKDWTEGREVRQRDLRGSGALRQYPHIILAVERNMMGQNKSLSTLRLIKNRGRGHLVGVCGQLVYNDKTGRLMNADEVYNVQINVDKGSDLDIQLIEDNKDII